MKNDSTLSTAPPRKPLTRPMTTPTVEAKMAADVAIVVVGTGPTLDCEGQDRPDLHLPGEQDAMVTAIAAAFLVVAVAGISRMGSGFLPEFHEGSLTVQANTLPGTSLAKSDDIGRRVEQILLAQPEVVATARRTGRAELDEHVQGVEAAEIDVGNDEVNAGDLVTIFGDPAAGVPSADDLAAAADTINYEIVTRIGGRFKRTYLGQSDASLDLAELAALAEDEDLD